MACLIAVPIEGMRALPVVYHQKPMWTWDVPPRKRVRSGYCPLAGMRQCSPITECSGGHRFPFLPTWRAASSSLSCALLSGTSRRGAGAAGAGAAGSSWLGTWRWRTRFHRATILFHAEHIWLIVYSPKDTKARLAGIPSSCGQTPMGIAFSAQRWKGCAEDTVRSRDVAYRRLGGENM